MPPAVYAADSDFQLLVGELPLDIPGRFTGLLEQASRLYDLASGVAPGHWGPSGTATFTFDAYGGDILRLRDEAGLQYLLRGVTADLIQIDDDLDGSYEYGLDFSDAWVEGFPRNAVANGEAFRGIRLRPTTAASITAWPDLIGSVRITGLWGYPAVPTAVRDRVCDIAHGLSQRGFNGDSGGEEWQAQSIPVWVMKLVDSSYSYRRVKAA